MNELERWELEAYKFAYDEILYDRAMFICVALQRYTGQLPTEEMFPLLFKHKPLGVEKVWWHPSDKLLRINYLQKLIDEIETSTGS
jgi:hypothetical protein